MEILSLKPSLKLGGTSCHRAGPTGGNPSVPGPFRPRRDLRDEDPPPRNRHWPLAVSTRLATVMGVVGHQVSEVAAVQPRQDSVRVAVPDLLRDPLVVRSWLGAGRSGGHEPDQAERIEGGCTEGFPRKSSGQELLVTPDPLPPSPAGCLSDCKKSRAFIDIDGGKAHQHQPPDHSDRKWKTETSVAEESGRGGRCPRPSGRSRS